MTLSAGGLLARDFLGAAFEPDDWVAVLLKASGTGRVLQRVAPVQRIADRRWLTWLRLMNAHRFNVYVSVNAMTAGRLERTAAAVSAVRHVFLDLDHDAPRALAAITCDPRLPSPTWVVATSPGRFQILWRVLGFTVERVDRLQKALARQVGADLAATSVAQTMRVPGFLNQKYAPPVPVSVEWRRRDAVYRPGDFPTVRTQGHRSARAPRAAPPAAADRLHAVERARRYLAAMPAAVAGQRGDALTFRVCCRVARGFALECDEAVQALAEWNARCDPPWSEPDLVAKLERALRYGREPIGGLRGVGR